MIFKFKRNVIDEIHEMNMEMEMILCKFKTDSKGYSEFDETIFERRYKLLQQKLRWSKDYRAIFNKVIETQDDYDAIADVMDSWLYVYMDPELWCELKEDNGNEYYLDGENCHYLEKYMGTTKEVMDELLYYDEHTKYKPRDYTPVITLDKHIMNTPYEEFRGHHGFSH
jgi:hypothetical protein